MLIIMQIKTAVLLVLMIVSGIFYYNWTNESGELITGKVVRVIDGDTVELEDLSKIRLKGINAPESFMQSGGNSTEFLKSLILNETVDVVSFDYDKYDRTLGYLFLEKTNINQELLKSGFATLYYYEKDTYYEDMKFAEDFARNNELGIWKKSNNFGCLSVVEFSCAEPEKLILLNSCEDHLNLLIKDDATHIYEKKLESKEKLEMNFSHIWNDEGDTLYIYDDFGLIEYFRY